MDFVSTVRIGSVYEAEFIPLYQGLGTLQNAVTKVSEEN